MGCNCSQGAVATQMQAMDNWASRSDGTYPLYTYPDCEGGHHGQYEGLSIFIVAPGTAEEKLFRREDLGLASDYLNTLSPRPSIVKVSTSSLCDPAVQDVYGR